MTSPATTASASGSRKAAALPYAKADWVLEGGAIDRDGSGTSSPPSNACSTPTATPSFDREEVEQRLERDLGFERVVWLGEGLVNDHTDGHVDNLARFVAPGRVAIPTRPRTIPTKRSIATPPKRLLDAGLDVVNLPSPGRGRAMTATSSRRAT